MRKFKIIVFWILSCTWGLPMTIIGAITALVFIIKGYKPNYHSYGIYFVVGNYWGGISLGAFFFVSNQSNTPYAKCHESGHCLQSALLGIFMPFLIGIPSLIRSKYRSYIIHSGKKTIDDLPDYYSIWFEKWASDWGIAAHSRYINSK